ncbi:MAG: serine hydrolase [Eubacteriales bacterium]|nr:serine hydrolase [Eubacteriales bacterium]
MRLIYREAGELKFSFGETSNELRPQYSVTKTFTALAAIIAESEGLWSLEDHLSEHLRRQGIVPRSRIGSDLKLRHLLSMLGGDRQARMFQSERKNLGSQYTIKSLFNDVDFYVHPAGTRFLYTNAGHYIIGVLLQQLSGRRLSDYWSAFFNYGDYEWEEDSEGCQFGASGLFISTEHLDLFAQALRGAAPEFLDPKHLKRMTTIQYHDSAGQNYGLGIWIDSRGNYRADGTNGQSVIISADRRKSLTMNANNPNPKNLRQYCFEQFFKM